MTDTTNLDVLVVYSATLATSAQSDSDFPFRKSTPQAEYNHSYKYFLNECESLGLSAAFTTSADITDSGECSSFWTVVNQKWHKNHTNAQAEYIFDKIAPTSNLRRSERKLLFSDDATKSFNKKSLHNIFFDKLETYQQFPDFCIPTVAIQDNKSESVQTAFGSLKKILQGKTAEDFTTDFVLKDRYGAAGKHVYKISENDVASVLKILNENQDTKFVLQPFLAFDKGFMYKGAPTAADIRLVIHGNSLLQCYLRIADKNDFRCNQHQGAEVSYVDPQSLPQNVLATAKQCIQKINAPNSLYALDFACTNVSNTYLIEGNYGPGINWQEGQETDAKMSKQLIEIITQDLADRVGD